MIVKVENLKEGYELLEDIIGLSNKPIMKRKTVLTKELISILQAFLIKEVNVELVSKHTIKQNNYVGMDNDKSNISVSPSVEKEKKTLFKNQYLKSIQSYKKEFRFWQSGIPVEISNIRNIIIPLIDLLDQSPEEILLFHKYVTKPDYIFHHSISVGLLSGYIAKKLNLSSGERLQVALAGVMSDSGLSKIDPFILNKQMITPNDIKEYKTHPVHSFKMIQNIPSLKNEVKIAVLQHHEKLNGAGYPLGETESKIHLYARIISVATIYHEKLCNSSTNPSPFDVLDSLIKDNFGEYDVKIINTLTSAVTQNSIGMKVKLSNGEMGEIVFINNNYPTRPMIKLYPSEEVINLMENQTIDIEEFLS